MKFEEIEEGQKVWFDVEKYLQEVVFPSFFKNNMVPNKVGTVVNKYSCSIFVSWEHLRNNTYHSKGSTIKYIKPAKNRKLNKHYVI